MSREIDRRDFSVSRVTPTRETELAVRALQLSSKLPGRHRIKITRFDPTTGNPRVIVSESAPGEEGNYIERALEHLRIISPVLVLHPNQPPEFVPDPYFQRTSTGAVAVHLRQHYKGLPIFQAAQTVRFAPDALKLLQQYDWPGNIRELENAVVRAAAMCDGTIRVKDLPERVRSYSLAGGNNQHRDVQSSLPEEFPPLSTVEGRYVARVLSHTGGNKQAAARVLEVDRKTLDRMIKRHGINYDRRGRANGADQT